MSIEDTQLTTGFDKSIVSSMFQEFDQKSNSIIDFSDTTKIPKEKAAAILKGLILSTEECVRLFAIHADIAHVKTMGPIIFSLLLSLGEKLYGDSNRFVYIWEKAFDLDKCDKNDFLKSFRGGNQDDQDDNTQIVPATNVNQQQIVPVTNANQQQLAPVINVSQPMVNYQPYSVSPGQEEVFRAEARQIHEETKGQAFQNEVKAFIFGKYKTKSEQADAIRRSAPKLKKDGRLVLESGLATAVAYMGFYGLAVIAGSASSGILLVVVMSIVTAYRSFTSLSIVGLGGSLGASLGNAGLTFMFTIFSLFANTISNLVGLGSVAPDSQPGYSNQECTRKLVDSKFFGLWNTYEKNCRNLSFGENFLENVRVLSLDINAFYKDLFKIIFNPTGDTNYWINIFFIALFLYMFIWMNFYTLIKISNRTDIVEVNQLADAIEGKLEYPSDMIQRSITNTNEQSITNRRNRRGGKHQSTYRSKNHRKLTRRR